MSGAGLKFDAEEVAAAARILGSEASTFDRLSQRLASFALRGAGRPVDVSGTRTAARRLHEGSEQLRDASHGLSEAMARYVTADVLSGVLNLFGGLGGPDEKPGSKRETKTSVSSGYDEKTKGPKRSRERSGSKGHDFGDFFNKIEFVGPTNKVGGSRTVLGKEDPKVLWKGGHLMPRGEVSANGTVTGHASGGRTKGGGLAGIAEAGGEIQASAALVKRIGSDRANIAGKSELKISARANAAVVGQASRTQVRAGGNLELGGDVRATTASSAKLGGAEAGFELWGGAGMSGEASADAALGWKKIGGRVKLGGTLGLGGGASINVSVSPQEVWSDVGRVGKKLSKLDPPW